MTLWVRKLSLAAASHGFGWQARFCSRASSQQPEKEKKLFRMQSDVLIAFSLRKRLTMD
jgi:hypothetical protein